MTNSDKLDGKTYGVRVTKKMEEEIEYNKEKYPLTFDPLQICREALLAKLNEFKGEKGIIREDITKVRSNINKVEEDIQHINNNLSILTSNKEELESKLLNLEETLEKTEERIEEGDVVMNLINAVEKIKNQYSIRTSPNLDLLNKLSQETKIKPEILMTLGKDYLRGKITRKELEMMEEERVRYLMKNRPESAPTFEFEATGENIINYLTGRANPNLLPSK